MPSLGKWLWIVKKAGWVCQFLLPGSCLRFLPWLPPKDYDTGYGSQINPYLSNLLLVMSHWSNRNPNYNKATEGWNALNWTNPSPQDEILQYKLMRDPRCLSQSSGISIQALGIRQQVPTLEHTSLTTARMTVLLGVFQPASGMCHPHCLTPLWHLVACYQDPCPCSSLGAHLQLPSTHRALVSSSALKKQGWQEGVNT